MLKAGEKEEKEEFCVFLVKYKVRKHHLFPDLMDITSEYWANTVAHKIITIRISYLRNATSCTGYDGENHLQVKFEFQDKPLPLDFCTRSLGKQTFSCWPTERECQTPVLL